MNRNLSLLLLLTSNHRTALTNKLLGLLLAFNAGAMNAGGFLVVGMYTSHMSGFISNLADHLVLGNILLVLAAFGVLLFFTAGAASTALLVNLGRQNGLRSSYALPLFLQAILTLLFGLIGGTLNRQTPFAVPVTVLLLSFVMGLQNALVTKMSAAQIRTTHMTGVLTDLGIELGKLFYRNRKNAFRSDQAANPKHVNVKGEGVYANRAKIKLFSSLLIMFMFGGIVGAAGFKYVGFIWVLPLAILILILCLPPLWADFARLKLLFRKLKQMWKNRKINN